QLTSEPFGIGLQSIGPDCEDQMVDVHDHILPAWARITQSGAPAPVAGPPAACRVNNVSASKVLLSTTSVYPESSASAFGLATSLGSDGVELMVGIAPLAADVAAVAKLSEYHGVPVWSVHAPVLLVTQNVWGTDPWEKLERSAEAVKRLGGDTVVVHPP